MTMEQNLSGERKDNTEEPSVASSNPAEPPLAQVELPKGLPTDKKSDVVIIARKRRIRYCRTRNCASIA